MRDGRQHTDDGVGPVVHLDTPADNALAAAELPQMAGERGSDDEVKAAVRKRLDLRRPVERDLVVDCLRSAIQAPTGGNTQQWRWVVVDDPGQRAAGIRKHLVARSDEHHPAELVGCRAP